MCDEMCCAQPNTILGGSKHPRGSNDIFCPLILHILHAKNSPIYLMASVQKRVQPSVLQAQTQLFHGCKIWKMRPAHTRTHMSAFVQDRTRGMHLSADTYWRGSQALRLLYDISTAKLTRFITGH